MLSQEGSHVAMPPAASSAPRSLGSTYNGAAECLKITKQCHTDTEATQACRSGKERFSSNSFIHTLLRMEQN